MGNQQTTKTNSNQEFVLSREEKQKNLKDYYNSLHVKTIESKNRTFRATIESDCHQAHRRQEAIDYFDYVHESFKEEYLIKTQNSNLKEKIKKRGEIFVHNLVDMVCKAEIQNQLTINLSVYKPKISINRDEFFESKNQINIGSNPNDKNKENIFLQYDSLIKELLTNDSSFTENLLPNSEEIYLDSQESSKIKLNSFMTKNTNESYSLINSETCETDFRTEQSKRENFIKFKEPLNKTKLVNTFLIDQKNNISGGHISRSTSPSEIKFPNDEEFNTKINNIRYFKVKKLILLNKNKSNTTLK